MCFDTNIIVSKNVGIKQFKMIPHDIDRIYFIYSNHLSKCGFYKYVIHNTIYKAISALKSTIMDLSILIRITEKDIEICSKTNRIIYKSCMH